MDEPRVEFPCQYPIKVIVDNEASSIEQVIVILKNYDSEADKKLERNPSKKGNYVSLRVQFWATGAPQLQALFDDLKTIQAVRMVL